MEEQPMPEPISRIDEPGFKTPQPLLGKLQREVADLLQRGQTTFPGAQPVSFCRRHLDELRREDYYVCEKSDGIRYLLYLTGDEYGNEAHYLIDRKNDYWFIHQRNLHFPKITDVREFHVQTVIDGELVMDDVGAGRKEPRFLVFDCLVLGGDSLLHRTLDKRLAYFQAHIMKPYKDLFKQYPEEAATQAFKVEMKDMQLSYAMEKMFKEVIPTVRHENDGLIFTCRGTPYQFGTDPHIVKWKAAEDNTIDFQMKLLFKTVRPEDFDDQDRENGLTEAYVDYEGYHGLPDVELWIWNGGKEHSYFSNMYMTEEEWESLKGLGDPLQDRIVECAMDEHKRWRFHRFRDDKHTANHANTVMSVRESIEDRVSMEELIDAAESIKAAWKARAARPATRPAR